jgi:hypothetical protein
MILGLVLGTVLAFGSQGAGSNERQEDSAVKQKTNRLELSLVTDRRKYKQHGKIRITVTLTNNEYVKDIFIYGTLGWGYYASLFDTISDAQGKRIQPKVFPDDLTPPISRNDASLFVKLQPRHFLGTYFVEELDQLNLTKPGKYSIFVEYHSPISRSDVDLRNFWSKEDGTIKSNVVYVEVLR